MAYFPFVDKHTSSHIITHSLTRSHTLLTYLHVTHISGEPRRDRFLIVGMSANSDSETKQQALDAGNNSSIKYPLLMHCSTLY